MKSVVSVFVSDDAVTVVALAGQEERFRGTVKRAEERGDQARYLTETLHRALDSLTFIEGTVFVVGRWLVGASPDWLFVYGVTLGYAARFGCRALVRDEVPSSTKDPVRANAVWASRQRSAA
jgi:hypothetical protein